MIDAIAFKFRTSTQWVHLLEKYGSGRGVYNRLRMWALDGTWERVLTALMAQADADEELTWASAGVWVRAASPQAGQVPSTVQTMTVTALSLRSLGVRSRVPPRRAAGWPVRRAGRVG